MENFSHSYFWVLYETSSPVCQHLISPRQHMWSPLVSHFHCSILWILFLLPLLPLTLTSVLPNERAGFSIVPCWHLVSVTCKESLCHRQRSSRIQPEWLKNDFSLDFCWSCLILIQFPLTSLVFPLTLTGFSIGLTLSDAIFKKVMDCIFLGGKGFPLLFWNITKNFLVLWPAVEPWGIPAFSLPSCYLPL